MSSSPECFALRARFSSYCAFALPALLLAVAVGCSGKQPGTGTGSTKGAPLNEAQRVLKQMVDAYAKANAYGDNGELRLQWRKDGKLEEQKLPFSVVLQRPNKLAMRLYEAGFTSDGQTAWAEHESIPGFVLKRPVSSPITLADIYYDDTIRSAFNGLAGSSLPIEMLLGTDVMDLILSGATPTDPPHLLSDDRIDDRVCRRVRIKRPDGFMVYWIDRETYVLRRIEVPTERLALTLADPTCSDIKLAAEFVDAQLNPPIPPDTFHFAPPPQSKIVERLDPTWAETAPLPPVDVLGKRPDDFHLKVVDGPTLSRTDLAGKVTVLLFVNLSGQGNPTLVALDEAYRQLGRRDGLNMYVVSVDGFSDEIIRNAFKQAKLTVPVARVEGGKDDPAIKAFKVQFVPSLFILDRQGVVQDNEIGVNPKLKDQLVGRIEDALAGKSLVESAQARYAERLRNYEQAMQAQAAVVTTAGMTKLAPKSQPKTLKLTQVWQNTELKKPGHITVADEKGKPTRVVVLDGLRTAGELDAAGKLVRSVDLKLPTMPAEAIVSFLRTAVDKDGKRYFVGSASAQQQLHVFDSDLKLIQSFPQEGTHAGISDVQMFDIDGDKRLELVVGYWGDVGLQAVSLDGIVRWRCRTLPENVQFVAITGPDKDGKRLILATTGTKTMAVVDENGELLKQVPIVGRGARLVQAADLTGDGSVELCAITETTPGSDVAVGFNAVGAELWNYALPAGLQPVPEMLNEMVVGGKVLKDGTGLWVFAGADGTLHFIDAAGKAVDSFGWGAAIRGLAVGLLDDLPTLFVSDEKGVTALRLER